MRNDVKNAIASAIQNAPGIRTVYTFSQKMTPQTAYPVAIVSLPKAHETRVSAQAPVGKKYIKYTAQLDIFNIDTTPNGTGQLAFEDLLDSIDSQLRLDPSLAGVVLGAAIEHIDTTLAPPQLVDGQNIVLLAVKQFDVLVQVTG
jgi:hypothetical protein